MSKFIKLNAVYADSKNRDIYLNSDFISSMRENKNGNTVIFHASFNGVILTNTIEEIILKINEAKETTKDFLKINFGNPFSGEYHDYFMLIKNILGFGYFQNKINEDGKMNQVYQNFSESVYITDSKLDSIYNKIYSQKK